MSSRPSQRDLATHCGLSLGTVSMALRNHPSIARQTRERVAKAAAEIGYRANPLVQVLMAQLKARRPASPGNRIAYVVQSPKGVLEDGRAGFFEGAREAAQELGFTLDRFVFGDNGISLDRLADILRARGIHGVVFGPIDQNHQLPSNLDLTGFAMSAIGYDPFGSELHHVIVDDYHNLTVAINTAIRLGYRRLALVIHPDADAASHYALSAALLVEHVLLKNHRELVLDRLPLNEKLIRGWLNRWRESAILLSPSPAALRAACASGKRCPEDFGFIQVKDRRYCEEDISKICTHEPELGKAAVELVVEQLYANFYKKPTYPKKVTIPGLWHEGLTTREQKPATPKTTHQRARTRSQSSAGNRSTRNETRR
jgi:DNA-binding LacI/PurR family transcriptional regulator